MEILLFWVEFDNGDAMWVTYSPGLVRNAVYHDYVGDLPEQFPLRFNFTAAKQMSSTMRNQYITSLTVEDTVYVVVF